MDAVKEFIRKNLFLTVLGACVIAVFGVALGGFRMPKSADSSKRIAAIEKEAKELSNLRSAGRSEAELAAAKEYVKDVTRARDELAKRAGQLNHMRRQPLAIQTADGKRLPLFPVDEAAYRDHNVRMQFRLVYMAAMDEILARLDPTDPPTQKEVEINKEQMISRKTQELQLKFLPDQKALILPAGVDPPVEERGEVGDGLVVPTAPAPPPRRDGVRGRGPEGPEGPTEIPQVDVMEMQQRAVEDLKARKAREGRFYANKFSLAYSPLPENVAPSLSQMWKANVNLWLHEHVVDAISRANEGARATPSHSGAERKNNIHDAAIKRLVRVAMTKMDEGQELLYEGEQEPLGRTRERVAYASGSGVATPQPLLEANTLTRHSSNPLFDVVPFSFTVVMDPTELDRLFRELRSVERERDRGKQRDRSALFTILDVSMAEPGTKAMRTRGEVYGGDRRTPIAGPAVSPPAEEMYYYGSGPVMQVTVKVEAVFLTEWSRDLMPREMLQRLPSGALREKDKERLGGAAAAGLGG